VQRPGRRRGLGRGLEALLTPEDAPATDEGALLLLDPALIDANPEQPRRAFDPADLAELAASIRAHGLLHPVLVQRSSDRYQLLAGERRLRAAQQAGLDRIPAVLRPGADSGRESLEVALVENLLRSDLNPIEEAAAYARLAEGFGMSHDAIAERLGRSRPAVTNAIRLLSLPESVQRKVAGGQLSAGHGRTLLGLPDPRMQRAVADAVERDGLSVRQTERLVADSTRSSPSPSPVARLSPDDEALRRGFEQALGLPVELHRGRRGGHVLVRFSGDEDLDALYRSVGGPPL
jgi:ParB family chromosome partitioning protein